MTNISAMTLACACSGSLKNGTFVGCALDRGRGVETAKKWPKMDSICSIAAGCKRNCLPACRLTTLLEPRNADSRRLGLGFPSPASTTIEDICFKLSVERGSDFIAQKRQCL